MTPAQKSAVVRCFWEGASLEALSQALDVPQVELEALLRADLAVRGGRVDRGPVSEAAPPASTPKGRRRRADVEAAVVDALQQLGSATRKDLMRATETTSGTLMAKVLQALVQRGKARRQGHTFTLTSRGARS